MMEKSKKKRIFQKKKPSKSLQIDAVISELHKRYAQIESSKLKTFQDLPLSPSTLKALAENGFETPTEIQKETLALSLQGQDILGAAKTGSGKTLAFLIPLLEKLFCLKWSPTDGLGALVITPTRELAYQIFEMLKKVGKYHDFSAGLVIGGKDLKFETSRLASCNIIICTPGRILQHMDENPNFDPSTLRLLILDEADRCLDMGFSQSMNAILANLPCEDRQTLLFSATQTRSVKDLARLSLVKPVFVSVHEHSENATPEKLTQSYIICNLHEKLNMLWSFIKTHRRKKLLIFMQSCKQVKYVQELFKRLKCNTSILALHGKLHQLRRMAIYDEFCQKDSSVVLLATDVAARGLDFPSVDWVIQMDCPEDAKTYLHRAGRTARASNVGQSLLMLIPSEEEGMLKQLRIHKIPIEKIQVDPRKVVDMQRKIEAYLASDAELKASAQRAFNSYLKSTFLLKNKQVFDVTKLDIDKFAHSLGLAVAPRVRFLQKHLKKKELNTNSESEEDEEGDEDLLTVKRKDHEIDDEGESGKIIDDILSDRKVKVITKASLAKKVLKKNIQANQKITFDEEGQGVEQGVSQKASIEGKNYDHEDEGQSGINLEKAKQILRAEDKFDRQLDKEKRKAKRREEKLKAKLKSKRNAEKSDDEEDSDESQEDKLDWLPDPDKYYSKSSEDEEDNKAPIKRKWKPPIKKKKGESEPKKAKISNVENLEDLALQLLKN